MRRMHDGAEQAAQSPVARPELPPLTLAAVPAPVAVVVRLLEETAEITEAGDENERRAVTIALPTQVLDVPANLGSVRWPAVARLGVLGKRGAQRGEVGGGADAVEEGHVELIS
jgi:hypothetical protein